MKIAGWSAWVTLVVLVLACGAPAGAEVARSMAELEERLKPGTEIDVVDREGRVLRGEFARADADGVLLTAFGATEGRRIPAGDVLTVTRKGDSLRNGLLIGTAVGLGSSLLVASTEDAGDDFCGDGDCDFGVEAILAVTATYAALGLLIDHLVKGREVVYRAPVERVSWSVAPYAVRGGVGLRLAVRY